MDINKFRLNGKTSYLIVNSEHFNATDNFLDAIAKELENGVQVVELRETCSAKEIIEHGKRIRELCSIYDALFIVYDRLDIAKIVLADGVFLPKNGIDIKLARNFFESNIIIGTTIDDEVTIKEKEIENFDYVIYNKIKQNNAKIHIFSKTKKLI